MCISKKTKSNSQAATLLQLVQLPLTLLTLLLLLTCLVVADANDVSSDLNQLIEAKLNESASQSNQKQELLSRKRRYLVFPEGSSFQMVFDEVICVVDYTNYLVMGITAALAWELPSKPPSEAFEDLVNKLNDGTIDVSRKDTISNITYVSNAAQHATNTNYKEFKPNYIHLSNGYGTYYTKPPIYHIPMHPTYLPADTYYRHPHAPARRKDYRYYYTTPGSRDPFKEWFPPVRYGSSSRFPYWALPSRHYGITKRPRQQKLSIKPIYTAEPKLKPQPKLPRLHKIYPVYGKRSVPHLHNAHKRQRRSGVARLPDEKLSKVESRQIKYHRDSRQSLFESIEKYLDYRGHNGHHCVLRTLCETGQKSHEQDPGSFVGELLRAIFTIPEALDHEPVVYRDTHYDKAHAHRGDCAALYPECKESIWDAPFIQ